MYGTNMKGDKIGAVSRDQSEIKGHYIQNQRTCGDRWEIEKGASLIVTQNPCWKLDWVTLCSIFIKSTMCFVSVFFISGICKKSKYELLIQFSTSDLSIGNWVLYRWMLLYLHHRNYKLFFHPAKFDNFKDEKISDCLISTKQKLAGLKTARPNYN